MGTVRNRHKGLLLFSVILCAPFCASAQKYLHDPDVPIALHERRLSRHKLLIPESREDSRTWGVLYRASAEKLERLKSVQVLSYLELPDCRESGVELRELFQHSRALNAFDVTYYSAKSKKQRKAAMNHEGRVVAYNPALVRGRKDKKPDFWQQFARFVKIDCLPTRYRFVTIGAKRYKEFRRGDKAWE